MHSLYSFDAHVYCFQVIFGILSICLRAEGASASWSSSWFGSGAGNKRVSIVSVRLSLIMKTAATLSLENASAITIASQSCHPPRSLLERDSLINATSLILETQSLLVLPPFVALSQRQLKFVAIGYGRRRRRRQQGGIWRRACYGESEFDFVCASFANHLGIAQHGDDLRATTSSLDHPHAYRPAPPRLFRSLHRNLIFHSDSAMGVNCAGLAKAKISARDFSTNPAPAGHSRRPIHLAEGKGGLWLEFWLVVVRGAHGAQFILFVFLLQPFKWVFHLGRAAVDGDKSVTGMGACATGGGGKWSGQNIYFFWIGKTCGKWLNYSWRVNFDLDFWKTEHNSSRLMGKTWI